MKLRDVKIYIREAPPAEPFAYSQAWYERVLQQQPIEQHGGWVEIPQGAGLGIAIDRAALARFAI